MSTVRGINARPRDPTTWLVTWPRARGPKSLLNVHTDRLSHGKPEEREGGGATRAKALSRVPHAWACMHVPLRVRTTASPPRLRSFGHSPAGRVLHLWAHGAGGVVRHTGRHAPPHRTLDRYTRA